jgi:tetratricopeptide (TPR) repeat protein
MAYVTSVDKRSLNSDRSFEIYKHLRLINPDKEQAEADYARGLWDQANRVREGGDNKTAIQYFAEAASIYEKLFNNGAGNKRYRRSASLTYKNLGSVHRVAGDPAAALDSYEKALAHDKQIAAESPDNLEAVLGLSFSHRGIGEALTDLRQFGRAAKEFDSAIAIQEQAFTGDTKNAFLADALHESYTGAGIVCRERSDWDAAESYFRKAFEIERSTRRDQIDSLHSLYMAKAHLEYGEMLMRKGGADEKAKFELQTALDAFDEIERSGAFDPAFVPHRDRLMALLSKV